MGVFGEFQLHKSNHALLMEMFVHKCNYMKILHICYASFASTWKFGHALRQTCSRKSVYGSNEKIPMLQGIYGYIFGQLLTMQT